MDRHADVFQTQEDIVGRKGIYQVQYLKYIGRHMCIHVYNELCTELAGVFAELGHNIETRELSHEPSSSPPSSLTSLLLPEVPLRESGQPARCPCHLFYHRRHDGSGPFCLLCAVTGSRLQQSNQARNANSPCVYHAMHYRSRIRYMEHPGLREGRAPHAWENKRNKNGK